MILKNKVFRELVLWTLYNFIVQVVIFVYSRLISPGIIILLA